MNNQVLRHNRQERWAGYLVMAIFGAFAWHQESITMRAGCVLIILGTLVMLYQLSKRAELVRQRDAVRAVLLWSVAPAVPGVAVLVWGMAESDPSGFPWLQMSAMFLLPFGVVAWMNLKAARKMQQKIDEIDARVT